MFVVGMFDVESGDVVGQEHDLIAEEVVGVFLFEDATGEATDDVDDEIACACCRIEDLDTWGLKRFAKFLLEHDIDAFDHEIDDLLWGIDDPIGISLFDGKTLKETFVDGVEETLPL